jgi:hypothetical protein
MKTGLLERVLIRRYGEPVLRMSEGMATKCWNTEQPDDEAVLYVGIKWHGRLGTRFASLKGIYGDAFGGYLIKNTLKVSVVLPRNVYGLWRIDEIQMLSPVKQALEMDPAIDFFMDEDNVLYYGHKEGELYVFDRDTDELDSLGPIEPALHTRMDEWEAAVKDL